MLAFLVTDVEITPEALRTSLQKAIDQSFNMVNIDNDMSTSDMVLIMANGLAKNRCITLRGDKRFQLALNHVLIELARMIARDGEGATRLIEVHIKNALTLKEAQSAARTVVGSNLVKAAVFGKDPNWGRIVAALGNSNARFDPGRLTLDLVSEQGRVGLVKKGVPASKRVLERAREIMGSREIEIHVDLAAGKYDATAWGCDLTYDYVRINSRYTT